MKSKRFLLLFPLITLTLLLVSSFYIKLSGIPIRIWDEARLANNALHMYHHGFSLITFYDGAPDMWNTKPPLMIWLQVASMYVFGAGEWAVRFPSATASIFTGLFLFFFGRRHLQNTWLGFLAGAVFASTMAYVIYHAGRTGDYDALLSFFTTLYCFSFYLYIVYDSKKWMYSFWMFLTLAVLTKGVAGLLFLPGLFLFSLFQKKIKNVFTSRATYKGLLGFITVVGLYYLLREKVNTGYLQAVYENELGGRFLKTLEEHRHPFGYYEDNMRKWRYRYWYLFFIPATVINFLIPSQKIKRLALFNFLMIFSYLLIISAGQTKLEWYDIPVYAFIALQIGILLYYSFNFLYRYISPFNLNKKAIAVLFFIVVFSTPFYQVNKYIHGFEERPWDVEIHAQSYFLQNAIRENKNLSNYIFCYEGYKGQIVFYIEILRAKDQEVNFHENTEQLTPGSFVVANQEKIKQEIEAGYMVKKKEEKLGCTVYYIIAKKTLIAFL